MGETDFTGRKVGHYFLLSRLGSGTGGSVYRGVDFNLADSPTYAVKCVLKSSDPRRRNQQFAEIKNHDAAVLCPHVLTLYEAFENEQYFFLVFPLCEMDMAMAIFQAEIYWRNNDLIKKAFVQLLDGVLACHMKGVYHRDLKPENIMCNAKGTKIRIADFGLSSNRRLCRDGGCGTVPYMSPECLIEKEFCYDANLVDIWALGVILFNMVTRYFPWDEASPEDSDYTAFLSKKNYLLLISPISESLNALLRQIWHPTPMKRMSIPAIRQAIMEMDTFYEPLCLFKAPYPLSKVVTLCAESQPTRVTPAKNEKKKDSRAPIDVLEDTFRRLELVV